MAGYIMTIGAEEYLDLFYSVGKKGKPRKRLENKVSSKREGEMMAKTYALEKCISDGMYSAKTSGAGAAFIGTLADYLGMKAGDNIYFFTNRRIYGIGELIDIAGVDCRFRISPQNNNIENLTEEKSPDNHHFVCAFKPAPFFFKNGIDMDEVLMFSPEKIRALRFFSGKTFIKLDDVENEAIRGVIARKNEEFLSDAHNEEHFLYSEKVHQQVEEKIKGNKEAYRLSIFDFIKYQPNGNVSSEYYLEGAIMDLLRNHKSSLLGEWDFIARQYPASPPKPSEYVEAMDLFGYRYVAGFPNAISKYLVIEFKTGMITKDSVQQTMKYVDWISKEYTKGDYSMIEAYTVGADKDDDIQQQIEDIIERNYVVEGRPVENRKWNNLKILSYVELLRELKIKNGYGNVNE